MWSKHYLPIRSTSVKVWLLVVVVFVNFNFLYCVLMLIAWPFVIFYHCIACPSSIYCFRLPLYYLETILGYGRTSCLETGHQRPLLTSYCLLGAVVMYLLYVGVRVVVFNATFNNISVISWRSVLLVEETGVSGENYRPTACH